MTKKESPSFQKTERALKRIEFYGDDVPLPSDEGYYEALHDKIMASIEQTQVAPVPLLYKEKDLLKRHWRYYVMVTMMFFLTLLSFDLAKNFSFDLFQNSHAIKSAQNEDQIISLISSSPEMLSETVLSYKSSDELFSDPAMLESKHLTKEVFDSL